VSLSQNFSQLLEKYSVAGPRYTSYPTVPFWEGLPEVDPQGHWIEALRAEQARAQKGASLYVHIPFCEKLCTYCGCNTRITRNKNVSRPYIDCVLAELDLYSEALGTICVSEIHLGGGTPTFLSPDDCAYLVDELLKRIELTSSFDMSLEADPRVTTGEHLKVFSERHFKRLSLGIQDFDPRVQKIVNRVQGYEQVKDLVDQARFWKFESINFDLIYGLPLQTLDSIDTTCRLVGSLRPDRIAFYGYAHVPWIKPSQRKFTEDDLPLGAAKRALYEQGRAHFQELGFLEIGMDHFALPHDLLSQAFEQRKLHRNFMGYTHQHVSPLIGLGVSAIGDAWQAFAQNEKQLERYQRAVSEKKLPLLRGHLLSEQDVWVRKALLDLMTRFEVHLNDPYLSLIKPSLACFEQDDLIEWEKNLMVIKPQGRAFLRNICMAFDLRLKQKQPQTVLFSQTI
jgi:oxygen-independent coproporphyrinogen-3 oxidase